MKKKKIIIFAMILFIFPVYGYCDYYALREDSSSHYIRCCLSLNEPAAVNGHTWVKINTPSDVSIYRPAQPITFDLDALDAWLDEQFSGTAFESFAAIIFRASAKDTFEGYQLMLKKADDAGISKEIQSAVLVKLIELGANVD